MDVRACSIHIASNAFLEGIKGLKDNGNVNVDQFAIRRAFPFQTICSEKRRLKTRVQVNRCDNVLCYKALLNLLAQPGQSASEDYRTV